jgi:hypothetical protein
MMIEVNYMAVLAATVVGFVVGFAWYHPSVFGTMWMRLSGISPSAAEAGKKKMMQSMVIGFVSTLVTAYVLAHFVAVWGATDFMDALQMGFWIWLGFQMPIHLGSVLWEQKSWNLFALNAAYWLVGTVAMAETLVWMI